MKLETLKLTNAFLYGYLVAAFWTNDNKAPSGDYMDSDRPRKMFAKLTDKALRVASFDCYSFKNFNAKLLEYAGTEEQNGQDFWLSRNGHGSGFFDRDYYEAIKNALQEKAKNFGQTDLYRGKFGWLYFIR